MRATSSLTNRVFLACTLLATLSLGLAFYFVDERASSEAEADLRLGLREAGTLVDRYGATRTDHFIRLARVVADLPKLKAAVETGIRRPSNPWRRSTVTRLPPISFC